MRNTQIGGTRQQRAEFLGPRHIQWFGRIGEVV
jgi:hypothetical protein